MKVLVIGYSKTGTKTMYQALNILGYKCYDYSHNFYYLRKEWMKVFTEEATTEDFYNMFKDVDASCDAPACVFWEEILKAFPDTKLIFMERDCEEDFLKSLSKTYKRANENLAMNLLPFLSPTAYSLFQFIHHINRISFGDLPAPFYRLTWGACPLVAKRLYRLHNDSVARRAPKDQTLKFSVREGWEPLCKFLDLPVPTKPFPYKNKGGAVFQEEMESNPIFFQMQKEAMISLSLIILFAAAMCYYFFFA